MPKESKKVEKVLNKLQDFLYRSIPLTKDMGLKLLDFTEQELITSSPLAANINDKGSVFGGSSSALMIISAWSLIKLNCHKHNIENDIVIHKNETLWNKALYDDLLLKAQFNQNYDFHAIKNTLSAGRHQRIECTIVLQDQDAKIYSTMLAKYVIIP